MEPALPRKTRDPRLDVFRGLCLVMIFINHVPGNVYEKFTSRNFGFSDAAEGFVLMSGIAAGLGVRPQQQRALAPQAHHPGRRHTGSWPRALGQHGAVRDAGRLG